MTARVSPHNLYREWQYAKRRNVTKHSLLKVLKSLAARRRAFAALRDAYERVSELPVNFDDNIFDKTYDDTLNELCLPVFSAWQAVNDEQSAFLPVSQVLEIDFDAEVSRNYSSKIDYFPLSRWAKDTRAALKHARKFNAAIDETLVALREEGYL